MSIYLLYRVVMIAIAISLLSEIGYSQSSSGADKTVKFNGQLVDGNGKGIEGVEVVLKCKDERGINWLNPPGNRKTTRGSSGEFQVMLEREFLKKIRKFKLEVDNEWKIIDPKDGEEDPRGEVDGEMFLIKFKCEKIEGTPVNLTQENKRLSQQIKLFTDTVSLLKNQIQISERYRDSLIAKLALVENNKKLVESKQIALLDTIKTNLRDKILTSLGVYIDDLKNLDQFIKPKNVKDAFLFQQTRNELERLVDTYNDSRANLAKIQSAYLAGVQDYWGGKQRDMLADVYNYALVEINEEILTNEFNIKVIERIDASTKQHKPRIVMQPKAVQASKEIDINLKNKLIVFLEKAKNIQRELQYN